MEPEISEEIQKSVSELMDMIFSENGSKIWDTLCRKYEVELRYKLPDSGDCPVERRKYIITASFWEIVTLVENDQDKREFLWKYLIKEYIKRDPDGISSKDSWMSTIEIYKQFRGQFSFNFIEMAQTGSKTPDGFLLKWPRFKLEYEYLGKIGKGGCCTVYMVTNKLDGISYALKLILFRCETKDDYKIIKREIRILANLWPHPNLIAYKTSWMEKFIVNGKSSLSKVARMAVSPQKTAHTSTELAKALETTDTTKESSTPSGSQQKPHHKITFGGSLYILTELCSRNLRTWIEERNDRLLKLASEDGQTKSPLDHIDPNECLKLLKQILIGVKVIHGNHVIHGDLKPENILLGLDGRWKIGDFGLATIDQYVDTSALLAQSLGKAHTVELDTWAYAAPEQLYGFDPYNRKVDIFSVGRMTFELFHPFGNVTERVKAFENLRYNQSLPEEFTDSFPEVADLILEMTSTSPNDRPDAVEILQSEIFSKDRHKEEDDHREELLLLKLQSQLGEYHAKMGSMLAEIEELKDKIRKLQDGCLIS